MRLGVHVSRLSQLPHMEGLVRAASARQYHVSLLLDTALAGGPKADQVPWPAHVPVRFARWADLISVTPEGMVQLVAGLRLDWLVMGYAPHLAGWSPRTRLAFVQGAVTDFMGVSNPWRWDRVYAWTDDWWLQTWSAWAPRDMNQLGAMDRAVRGVGMPMADHLAWIDPAEVRRTFGFGDKPVVLLLPFPFHANTRCLWADLVWGGPWPGVPTDRAFVRALRGYCDRVGALLVVKARSKVATRAYLRRAADVVVEADEPGEPTLLRLLTVASLMVHAYSTATAEAAAAGVPALCLAPGPRQWPAYRHRLGLRGFLPGEDGFYGWSGVSERHRPAAAIEALRRGTHVPHMVTERRQSYIARFLGGEPFRAGARMLDDMEAAGAL